LLVLYTKNEIVNDAVLRADELAFEVAFPETKHHYKLGRLERGFADPRLWWLGFLGFVVESGPAMKRGRGVQWSYYHTWVTSPYKKPSGDLQYASKDPWVFRSWPSAMINACICIEK
jgi:hypothetical protein